MTTLTSTPSDIKPVERPQAAKKPVHLPFLDGIRALMALWVASGHAFQDFIHVVDHHSGREDFFPQPFFQQAFFAHFAVDVFIVLSGFCLMLPVAKERDFSLSGGWRKYLSRRAKRILPPYYCALVLALAMSGLRWWITRPGWESQVIGEIDFRPSAILAHIFLVQNMWDLWARAIDGPTWSVATEFQIYLLFPLLLLPLWRRLKPVIVIPFVSAVGVSIFFLTQSHFCSTRSGLTSCSWYIGLFAMGMCAAEWYTRRRSPWMRPGLLAFALAALTAVLLAILVLNWMPLRMWALDLMVGAGTASLLAYWSSYSAANDKPASMNLLEWPPLVTLGAFSYSFYLIHAPLLNVVITLLLKYNAAKLPGGITIVCSLAVIVFVARIFYKYIELPSMAKKPSLESATIGR